MILNARVLINLGGALKGLDLGFTAEHQPTSLAPRSCPCQSVGHGCKAELIMAFESFGKCL